MHRVFLLSPAHCGGKRAQLILNPNSAFTLARRLQQGETVGLGEIFSFLSGLYFRGKLAYARTFARPPLELAGAFVITPDRGLLDANAPLTIEELRLFSRVPIDEKEPRYRRPLERDLRELATANCQVVLLGSISTSKYVDVLLDCLGDGVYFPAGFVGRGDMSRGGLLLRCVRDARELEYERLAGAVRRGPRPPKLEPCSWKRAPFDLPSVRRQRTIALPQSHT